MKRRLLATLMAGIMAAGVLAGCGSSTDSASSADSTAAETTTADAAAAEGTTDASQDSGEIYVFISSPEYADAMQTLIDEYKNVAPNLTINYETTQNDYPTLLKAKLNSGDVPDIFSSTSGMEIDTYREYSYDLTGQPIVDAMDDGVKAAMASPEEGSGVYGLAIKGNYFGLIWNQDILDECGLEAPTTFSEFKNALETVEAAGYQGCTNGFMEWWVFKHDVMDFLNAAAKAKGEATSEMVAKFQAGEAKISDYDVLYNGYFDFIDLINQYGDDKPLETDLAGQEQAFALGNTAFMVGQGAWVEADLLAINPELNIGFGGYPCTEDPADCQVVSGSDQALHVNKDSENLQAVLNFVNWWYTSDYGQAWFTDVAGVVPPIKSDAESTFTIINQGKAAVEANGSGDLSICFSTDSFNQAFGEAMQSYVAGTADKDTTCAQIEKDWHEIDGAQ